MTQIVQVAAIALAALSAGAAKMTVVNEAIPDLQVPKGAWVSSGALNGLAFTPRGCRVACHLWPLRFLPVMNSSDEWIGVHVHRNCDFSSQGSCAQAPPIHIIPPIPPISDISLPALPSLGLCATIASVVINSPATRVIR